MRVYTPRMREGVPGRMEDREISKTAKALGIAGYLFTLWIFLMLGFQIGKYFFGG